MPREWDGLVSAHINRKLSVPLARSLLEVEWVTPNGVTLVSTLVGLLSAAAFFFLNPLLGALLAQASSVLDGVDGDLAEMRGQKSGFGAFLDSVLDRFVDVAIIMGVARYSLGLYSSDLVLPAALGAVSGGLLVSYVAAKGELDLGSPLRSGFLAAYLASRDVRLFLVMVFGLASRPLLLLGVLAVTTYVSALARLVQTVVALGGKGRV